MTQLWNRSVTDRRSHMNNIWMSIIALYRHFTRESWENFSRCDRPSTIWRPLPTWSWLILTNFRNCKILVNYFWYHMWSGKIGKSLKCPFRWLTLGWNKSFFYPNPIRMIRNWSRDDPLNDLRVQSYEITQEKECQL